MEKGAEVNETDLSGSAAEEDTVKTADLGEANTAGQQLCELSEDGGGRFQPKDVNTQNTSSGVHVPTDDADPSGSNLTMKAAVLGLLQLLPQDLLPAEKYNREIHGPRVHMSDTIKDREARSVIVLTLRGKNFTQTKDVELHEDSLLVHLFLAVEQTFGLPMVHIERVQNDGVEAEGGEEVRGALSGQRMDNGEALPKPMPATGRLCATLLCFCAGVGHNSPHHCLKIGVALTY